VATLVCSKQEVTDDSTAFQTGRRLNRGGRKRVANLRTYSMTMS